MVDCRGRTLVVGGKVVVMSGPGRGEFGYVHRISTYPGRPRTPGALVYDCPPDGSDGPPEAMTWGSWLRESELSIALA